jgi:hypothetical protein
VLNNPPPALLEDEDSDDEALLVASGARGPVLSEREVKHAEKYGGYTGGVIGFLLDLYVKMLLAEIPLPYVFHLDHAFVLSLIVTGAVFFAIGSAKSRWSTASWLRSGLVTLFVGGIAASLAYVAGMILRTLAG